jgi:hypothetical protein
MTPREGDVLQAKNVSHYPEVPNNDPKSVIRLYSFWSARLLHKDCFTVNISFIPL